MDEYDPWPDLRESILRYAEFDAKPEFYAQADACPTCRALHGQVFEAREAPRIPVFECTNEFCRCDYLPRL